MDKVNGHEHIHTEPHAHAEQTSPAALETITITVDPATGQVKYSFRNTNYATVLQRLALTQFLVYDDMKKDLAERAKLPTSEVGSL